MQKKQGKNSKKAKKQRRKHEKAEAAAAAAAAAKCTDLVVFEGVTDDEELWRLDLDEVKQNEQILYAKKDLRRVRKARQKMTTYPLSTASQAGPVSAEEAKAFRRAIAAKYDARWHLAMQQLSGGGDVESTACRLLSEIDRLHRYEWKNTFGAAVLALDSLSVFQHVVTVIEARGISRQLSCNFDGAIEDFSLVIEANELLSTKAPALYRRGQCLVFKGNLKAALVDFQAALAALSRPSIQFYQEIRSGCQQDMLRAFVLQAKHEKSDARPLFSKKQRYKIGEALGTGLYDLQQFRCDHCGSTNVPDACEAGFCSRCEVACYCSVECHQQAWSGGHKSKCFRLRYFPHFVPDMYREEWEKLIANDKDGFSISGLDTKVIASCMLRDKSTGRLFEALSNRDVYFLPSEFGLVPENCKSNAEGFIAENGGGGLTGQMEWN